MSQGKSLALSQGTFLQPPSEDEGDVREPSLERQKRHANLYDAIAGRVAAGGFVSTSQRVARYRDRTSSSTTAVRPEEVLFRRQSAPIRYEENDFYFAHEDLPPDCSLPDSEMLQAIHSYCSDFYDRATLDRGQDDFRSMDETALIAMGVLLEEMATESLGETGDLVLVEGEMVSENEGQSNLLSRVRTGRKRTSTGVSTIGASSGEQLPSVLKKQRKRRKLTRTVSAANTTTGEEEG
ncbi:hypothetical protein DTO021D3_7757 [Paecilomyces variotii]|nr:hypothetical protein DTO032I3_3967 [Paecilomyces variotii]KAJ9275339.1 hypothetical protein DTO021D3_7757 [Paecilomyces variotii]KAJ9339513.1 hypothetical protein DTO027B6_7976 [Paecilomyces variotii]KAJ9380007.1 hypothetical protein DTO032I4_6971 [Paecilomyces variotii]